MSEDRRIGSQAPLWRMGGPVLALRVAAPFLLLFAGSVAFVKLGPGDGPVIAAWVLGCFTGVLLVAAAIGAVALRRMSAKVREFAAAEGLTFAVRDRQLTGGWRIAPDSDGALSRDVVTGTVAGRPLTSFLHQSYRDAGRSRGMAGGLAARHILGVRVSVVDVDRELPTMELTPRRLKQVEKGTLPTGDPVSVGMPEIEAAYHLTADDPAFAAELLSPPVVAALREAPQVAVRTCGTRLVALAPPVTGVRGLDASIRVLTAVGARLAELPASTPPARAVPSGGPAYVSPSVGRWRLAPFDQPLAASAMRDVRRGLLGDRPYLTFVREHVIGSGKDRQVQREQVIAVALPARLPRLEVWPENTLRRIAPSLAVREDIDIESDEFNDRFQVAADDRKYAVDMLNPRAVAALLPVGDFEWRVDGSDLVGLWNVDAASPDVTRARLDALRGVAELIPAHVVADHGWAAEPALDPPAEVGVAPVRTIHVVLAVAVGLAVSGAGVPIALAVAGDQPGAWLGGILVVGVITAVAVALTIIFGRVVDTVRRSNSGEAG